MWTEWICKLHSRPPPGTHRPLSDASIVAIRPHLLSLPSHAALGCSFHLLPLYQAIPTGCLCKHNERHGCTPGPGVGTAEKTGANLWTGPLRPSCLAALITQDIKARRFCRSQLLVDKGQRRCMCPRKQIHLLHIVHDVFNPLVLPVS